MIVFKHIFTTCLENMAIEIKDNNKRSIVHNLITNTTSASNQMSIFETKIKNA